MPRKEPAVIHRRSLSQSKKGDHDHDPHRLENNESGLYEVMQRQNEITAMLVKQQTMSYLPSRDSPVFKGHPLTYRSFIRAFDHAVDSNTDGYEDKLYYLEQYTSGEPHKLVRSCEHMSAERGYSEARRLLQKHYGDECLRPFPDWL